MSLVKLPNGQLVDDDLSMGNYKLETASIHCRIHGNHCRSVFHYPTESDRRTYYACLPCIEEQFGVELKQHPGVIRW